ncbi:MAG: S8 family serine peptidase, partial [Pseudomonadota bacterium]
MSRSTIFTVVVLFLFYCASAAANPRCEIRTSSAVFDTCTQQLKLLVTAPESLQQKTSRSNGEFTVIKYRGPIAERSRQQLAAAGVEIVQYLPWYSYVVRTADALPNDPEISWQGAIQPIWKISPDLFDLEAAYAEAEVPIRVQFWPGAAFASIQNQLLDSSNVQLQFQADSPLGAYLGLRVAHAGLPDWLANMAELDQVRSISLMRPARLLNSEAGWLHQSGDAPGNLPVFEQGIFGCGQTIGVLDSGFDYGSCAFRDDNQPTPTIDDCATGAICPSVSMDNTHRKIGLYYNWSGGSAGDDPCGGGSSFGHGTHVAGSISGNQLENPTDCDNLQTPGALTDFDGTSAPGVDILVHTAGRLRVMSGTSAAA